MMHCDQCNKNTSSYEKCEHCGSSQLRKVWDGSNTVTNHNISVLTRPLLLVALLFVLVIVTMQNFPLITQTVKNNQPSNEYGEWEIGQRALDDARKIDTLEAYQSFIDENPNNMWVNNFIYYRDRAAFNNAKKIDTFEAYQHFINSYPNSDWMPNAIYYQSKAGENSNNGKPSNIRISRDERADINYRAQVIKAFDVGYVFLKDGAEIRIIRMHNRSNLIAEKGTKVEHIDLYDKAHAAIDGGDDIGYLTLYDESKATINNINKLSWLTLSSSSKVFINACNVHLSDDKRELKGEWVETGESFSILLVRNNETSYKNRLFNTLPSNISSVVCNASQ